MIVQELQTFLTVLQRGVLREKAAVDMLADMQRTLTPVDKLIGMKDINEKHNSPIFLLFQGFLPFFFNYENVCNVI